MRRVTWDLSPYAGKTGYLEIIDDASGGWGHINVDDFRFSAFSSPPVPNYPQPEAVIAPESLRVRQGEVARFTSRSTHAPDTSISEAWSGPLGEGTGHAFLVNTKSLKPGRYKIMLQIVELRRQITNALAAFPQRRSATASAELIVEPAPVQSVDVPNLIGQQKQYALEILEEAGLRVGRMEERVSDRKAGIVVDQMPEPGGVSKLGSAMDLVIAKAQTHPEPTAVITPKTLRVRQGEVARFESRSDYETGDRSSEVWNGPSGAGKGHSFRFDTKGLKPGEYKVSLTVTDAHRQSDTASAVLIVEPAPTVFRLELFAEPAAAGVNESVTFRAVVAPEHATAQYRFDFGDGRTSGWQERGEAVHRYRAAGTYTPVVEMRIGETRLVEKRSVEIRPVTSVLHLAASPSVVKPGEPVTVHAQLDPPGEAVRYRFDFGDGSAVTEGNIPEAVHTYGSAGTYRVEVHADSGRRKITEQLSVTVREPAVPPWVAYGTAGFLGLLVALRIYRRLKPRVKEEPSPPSEKVSVTVHSEQGTAAYRIDKNPCSGGIEVRLRRIADAGRQRVDFNNNPEGEKRSEDA
jgi:PKD repeat protein